jgi:class 3 adenylate cyclase
VAAIAACRTCGTEPLEHARFCHGCGSPVEHAAIRAEFKQVTVLFADVVRSMHLASAVGTERLREIMADLTDRCAAVVQRFGGTLDKFTGDGIMAVFGAPLALEDHAIRACLAALGIQEETMRLASEVKDHDGVDLQLRVGLNSGQVIAGEIGSASLGYTAIGEQVGLAQRMESAAPPGGVMLSASTARLVDGTASLGEVEHVHIKGTDEPVGAQPLLSVPEGRHAAGRAQSNLVGRRGEMATVEDLFQRFTDGHGAVVTAVGPPGIGKSRLVRELAAMAGRRGVEVFATFCESHTSQVPFHAVARLLREATGVNGLDPQAARARIRTQASHVAPEDLVLLDDLLGIADRDVELPQIDPDARRRRLTALVNAASLAREAPAFFVVEDAHWIDEVSESMLAEFFAKIPQTPSLVLVTYRPEYRGVLTRMAGAQTIALAPLTDSETAALVSQLLGSDSSIGEVAKAITDKAAGNPFFAEEMVRELAERRVLDGDRGSYRCASRIAEVTVPATLHATLAARIDRLSPGAKRTLNARGDRIAARCRTVEQRCGPRAAGTADRRRPRGASDVGSARRVRVLSSADPHGGLRIAVEGRPRRSAPSVGRRDRPTWPGLGRRERHVDRRTSGGCPGLARRVRSAHAGRLLADGQRHPCSAAELGTRPPGCRRATFRIPRTRRVAHPSEDDVVLEHMAGGRRRRRDRIRRSA